MTDQDNPTLAHIRAIAHGLKRWEAEFLKAPHERISFMEIMAAQSGPAEILFGDQKCSRCGEICDGEPDGCDDYDCPMLEPRRVGGNGGAW